MLKLSKRLSHIADMVSKDVILADVGTDHGYIPIYLCQTGKIKKAYAMDIGRGPLLRAKEHIDKYGLGDYITTRLSDGVTALEKYEADAILIAGMGGGVTLHILKEGEDVISSVKELILQPQSEIAKVREYLYKNEFVIDLEDMVYEDGKYYPMMRIKIGEKPGQFSYSYEQWQMIYRYGEGLLKSKHQVLHQFLLHTIKQYETILMGLKSQPQTKIITARKKEIETELNFAKMALLNFSQGV